MKEKLFANKNKIKITVLIGLSLALMNPKILAAGAAPLITTVPPAAPAGYQNTSFFKAGLLNVVDYGATPNNNNDDDGPNIQNALDDAYAYHLVCYFPSGTYKINNKLECVHNEQNRRTTYMLSGEKGSRPVLLLKSGASGYGNTSTPKPFLKIWTMGSGGGVAANNGFNNVVRGIDFDLNGNAGAMALEFAGAQGCAVEDVRIDATGAYCGFYRSIGVNGGYVNVEVEGGQYAIYLPGGADADFYPIFTGCRFYNQTQRVAYIKGRSPITFVGFHIKKVAGPVFETLSTSHEAGGNMTLMDGIIEITGTQGLVIDNKHNGTQGKTVYMKDVYIHNAKDVIQEPNGTFVKGTNGGWTEVKEYGWAASGLSGTKKNGRHLVNGVISSGRIPGHTVNTGFAGAVPTGAEIVARHIWNEASFPAWNDSDTYNAVEDGGLDNTGVSNVTTALNNMLANNHKVFLPKGIYKIDNTIRIPGNTKLFGISKTFSIIRPKTNWLPANEKYIIDTDNNKNVAPLLAWIWLDYGHDNANMVSLFHWKAGRNSMIRNIFSWDDDWPTNPPAPNNAGFWGLNKKLQRFSGGGGGKIYGLCTAHQNMSRSSEHPGFRAVFVDQTNEPLNFYGFNAERIVGDYQCEFYRSSNIGVFGGKTEGPNPRIANDRKSMIGVVECDNIIIGTVGASTEGCTNGWVDFVNSTNVLGVNFTSQTHHNIKLVREIQGGTTNSLNANTYELAVFQRGNTTIQTFDAGSPPLPPGGNLVLNPSFETSDFTDWTVSGTVTNGNGFSPPDGVRYAKIKGNSVVRFLEQSVSASAGVNYTVSGNIWMNSAFQGGGNGASIQADFMNGSTLLQANNVSGNVDSQTPGIMVAAWNNFSQTLTATANTTGIRIKLVVDNVPAGNAKFDMITVEEGGSPPPPSNTAPILAAIGNANVPEGANSSITISASDADGNPLTLSATGLPWFCTLADNGDGTGSISSAPNFSSSGSYTITVNVNDGNGGSDSDSFVLTVNNVNRTPTIAGISNQAMNENANLNLSLSSSDADGDPLSFSASGLPSFASLSDNGNGTGSISFSPGNSHSGSYTVNVSVSDGNGGSTSDPFTLTVNNVNQAPILTTISNQTVNENANLNINLSSSDADGDPLALSASGLPNFCTLTDNGDGSGIIGINPDYTGSGVYSITVSADDGNGGSDSDAFTLTVNNINQPPSIGAIANQNIEENGNLVVSFSMNDPDPDDILTLSTTGLPPFAVCDEVANTLTFDPTVPTAGSYPITLTVDDGNSTNNTDSTSFILTVDPASQTPTGVFYENDFTTPGTFSTDFGGPTGSWSVTNGKLQPTATWKRIYLNTPGASTLADYTFDIDATTITPGNNNKKTAAVMVRYQSDSLHYQIQVDRLGNLLIRKKNGGFSTLAQTTGNLFSQSVNLSIDVYGGNPTTIDVYVDSATTPSLSATDSNAPITFGAPAFESRGTSDMEFDNMLVSLPASNLLLNGNFETGSLDSWIVNAARTSVITGANAFDGTSAEVICNGKTIVSEQFIPATTNTNYLVDAEINVVGISSGSVKFKADFRNASGAVIGSNNISGNISQSTNGYTHFSGLVTAPANTADLRIRIVCASVNSGAIVRFDNITAVDEYEN